MPEGRMLSKSIATSEQVASVSLLADYLFTRMIPHLDSEGRMSGSPRTVRGVVCPLRDDVTTVQVTTALGELAAVGLIQWYTVEGQQYVEFPKFRDHQRGARFDREGPSRIPASTDANAGPVLPVVGATPEQSGTTPGVLPLSEVKLSEVKGSPAAKRRTAPDIRPPDEPERFPKAVCDAGYEAYLKFVGSVEYPRFRKALLPIYRSALSVPPTEAELVAAIEAFAEAREADNPKFRTKYTVETFAGGIREHVRIGAMPFRDEWGEPTERGRIAGMGVGA